MKAGAARLGLLALAAAFLAGCAAPAAPAPAAAPDGGGPLTLSGCHGALASLNGLASSYPSSAPAGWGPGASPLFALRVVLLRCDRVSWGPFERGPIDLAQEWRDDFQAPAACQGHGSEFRYLLESIAFSDADLAARAAGLGMPARAADFAVTEDGGRQTWTWGPPGEPPSTLALMPGPGLGERRDDRSRRLLWADGAGVGALDLRYRYSMDMGDPPLAAGELRPPTLYGRANAEPAFATVQAELWRALDAQGTLERYGDTRCERPL